MKFKVHGSSSMEFPDWVQVKEKTLQMAEKSAHTVTITILL